MIDRAHAGDLTNYVSTQPGYSDDLMRMMYMQGWAWQGTLVIYA